MRRAAWLLVAGPLLACASPPTTGPAPDQPPAAPYQPVADMRQTMAWILLPAAEVIWDSAGTVITAEGRTELAPTTPEGWEAVRRGALLLAESGNLLMLPGRVEGPEWIAYSRGLQAASLEALAAAEARDPDALFDAGGTVYQACVACHARYWIRDPEAGAAR